MEILIDRKIDRQKDGQIERWIDKNMDRWKDGQEERWIEKFINDRLKYSNNDRQKYSNNDRQKYSNNDRQKDTGSSSETQEMKKGSLLKTGYLSDSGVLLNYISCRSTWQNNYQ